MTKQASGSTFRQAKPSALLGSFAAAALAALATAPAACSSEDPGGVSLRDANDRPSVGKETGSGRAGGGAEPARDGGKTPLSADGGAGRPETDGRDARAENDGAGETPTGPAGSPVASHGQLHVCGLQLCDRFDNPIQLRGMSSHGLQWYGWGKCITPASLEVLVSDWGADVLRASLYVQEDGYETDPAGFRAQVDAIVDEAVRRGIYVILDWHMLTPGDPNANTALAKEYFGYMARAHGGLPNVIYEIANEPNGDEVRWSSIKRYADAIFPALRASDPDGVVLVGTPDWSSLGVSGTPATSDIVAGKIDDPNAMYTFHFYAATHGDPYLAALDEASQVLPMFVSEWGTQNAAGEGDNDFAMAQKYLDLMARKKIGWANWNYSDDERSGAAFKQGSCQSGDFSTTQLKPAGAWVRERILTRADAFPTP